MRVAKLVEPRKIAMFDEQLSMNLSAGEAIVQVKTCGICGTDMHIFAGRRADVAFPRVMGHELSGCVIEVGEGVENIRKGDRVVLDPVMACGSCSVCRRGHANVCAQVKCFGVQMDGGFQDYITVPAKQLYRIPDATSYLEAALIEPFSIAANILTRANAESGEKIVIIGSGTIGLCVLQAAEGLGCEVLVSDILDTKLTSAKAFGAQVTVNTKEESLEAAVAAFAPDGPDIVIDCVGSSKLLEQCLRLATPLTRIIVISFDENTAFVVPAQITKKELTIIGSRMNAGKFPKVLQWLEDGMIHPSEMISKVFPVERIQQAFELAVSDSNLKKIVISFE